MNLPNAITVGRFFLSLIYFVILGQVSDKRTSEDIFFLHLALGLFLIAAVSDFLDGYFARKYHCETLFGRIADPLVDKVLICGSLIFFLTFSTLNDVYYTWMVVVVVVREFLIHGVRALMEGQGIKFGASVLGKQKMLIQSVTVIATLLYLIYFVNKPAPKTTVTGLLTLTLAMTVGSGLHYLWNAWRYFVAQKPIRS